MKKDKDVEMSNFSSENPPFTVSDFKDQMNKLNDNFKNVTNINKTSLNSLTIFINQISRNIQSLQLTEDYGINNCLKELLSKSRYFCNYAKCALKDSRISVADHSFNNAKAIVEIVHGVIENINDPNKQKQMLSLINDEKLAHFKRSEHDITGSWIVKQFSILKDLIVNKFKTGDKQTYSEIVAKHQHEDKPETYKISMDLKTKLHTFIDKSTETDDKNKNDISPS